MTYYTNGRSHHVDNASSLRNLQVLNAHQTEMPRRISNGHIISATNH